MTGNERVHAAVNYRKPDKVPVEYLCTDVGYYMYGDKLNTLYASLPGDFAPFRYKEVSGPAPGEIDESGNYHAFHQDEWGTVWEYRIYGITGIPYKYPLDDWSKLQTYRMPPFADLSEENIQRKRAQVTEHKKQYYYSMFVGNLFEKLIALREESDVLCDIQLDEPEINQIADRIAERNRSFTELAVRIGADGIRFGDDYGMEHSLVMNPKTWRRFIKPRLQYIFEPAIQAGLDIHFHSCGYVDQILDDLAEIGVNSIWPQLPAYDMNTLARRCRELQLAIAIHTDRANTMTYGTPDQVRDLVKREYDVFKMGEGGSWFYIEADNGFPYENMEALVKTITEIR